MKKCPKCNKTYNDSWEVCLTCRTELEDIGSPQDYSKNLIKNTKVQEPVTETKRRMVMYCRNCGKKINDKAISLFHPVASQFYFELEKEVNKEFDNVTEEPAPTPSKAQESVADESIMKEFE